MNLISFQRYGAWLLAFWLAALPAWGRGGGGCFEQGTLIRTAGGPVPIEQLRAGDSVISWHNGRLHSATVQAVFEVQPEEYLVLQMAGRALHVTAEHPVQIAPGTFQTAASLQPGDTLWLLTGAALKPTTLVAAHREPAGKPAYNLLVTPGGTYFAADILVHNKGCFLPDTPVLRADGSTIPIASVVPGERLMAFTPEGHLANGSVQKVITHEVDEYWVVTTEQVQLRVTAEHPFFVGNGRFQTLETMRVGDTIYAPDGQALKPQRIVGMQLVRERVQVYNLQTDAPHTYFANGIAVHNKGGCFPAGTLISTPRGAMPIERLAAGDMVYAVTETGKTIQTSVQIRFENVSPLVTITTESGQLVTTAEHPLLSQDGKFLEAESLRPGDTLIQWRRGRLRPSRIQGVEAGSQPVPVFNLRVGEPHTFVASGVVVHNKGGGCFPAGTLIQTATGTVAIEQLQPGASLIAIDEQGHPVPARLRTLFKRQAPLVDVITSLGTLTATADHPLRRDDGSFREAGDLQAGDRVSVADGRGLQAATVTELRFHADLATVYNLAAEAPHTFIANGFVVHNKGGSFGGGGRSYGGSSRSGGGTPMTAEEVKLFTRIMSGVMGFAVLCFLTNALINRLWGSKDQDEDLDFTYSRKAITAKSGKTLKLIEFISRVDQGFAQTTLEAAARGTFLRLQACWQARNYGPMEPLLMRDLYLQHCKQLKGLVRNHEINVIADLKVHAIDLVHVRHTHKPDDREFTALITASSRDHYVDDRTQEFLRGDTTEATFQEFWTFQLQDGKWLLREIEQTRESDALKDENFFEQFTDEGVNRIYDEEAGKQGPIGPWLNPEAESKASRTERLLNFLATTDRLWNRSEMLKRARMVFLEVKLAWETLNMPPELRAHLFPDIASDLKAGLEQHRISQHTFELRNLCVRKVELLLVRNFTDNSADEFTVRIHAHAQQIVRRSGKVVSEEEYVTPFEEYWTFGRLDNQWKLKEVLPPKHGKGVIDLENIDEESSPEQLQWFYTKTRAG